ncbi:MAG: hypothetical protein IPI59_06675 [Sphingobacteriales bacterium]|jgi:hypothetical protein|nr:hypothetical protein [Sphingobacteriales bacterium]MBP9140981.1 hypothetical protein [Chitinophagales bacterium]MDA0198607.1 hypothetical protein [Bacteroidota bacterium]MBK6890247.1 hypothetical protein [Sphingobacteriales bacterium]MBK7527226.1 hypothetical protein [Sphingobacteriales bacterium]
MYNVPRDFGLPPLFFRILFIFSGFFYLLLADSYFILKAANPISTLNFASKFALPDTIRSSKKSTKEEGVFLASLSPAMLRRGQTEGVLYHALTTQLYGNYNTNDTTFRFSQLSQIGQVNIGIFRSGQLNLGLTAMYNHYFTSSDIKKSVFALFGGDSQTANLTSVPMLAFNTRVMPLPNLPELSLQVQALLPGLANTATRSATNTERLYTTINATFYQQFKPWIMLFAQAGLGKQWQNNLRKQTSFALPAALYTVFTLKQQRWYAYLGAQYTARYDKSTTGWFLLSRQLSLSPGLQYKNKRWLLFCQFDKPLQQELSSQSIRALKNSYWMAGLGLRVLF